MPKTLVQLGAGNIGRSFIGQLFAAQGWHVIFVDIDAKLIDLLNQAGGYRVIIKAADQPDQTLWVRNVRGLVATDQEAVVAALADADLAATAVGPRALPALAPLIARALQRRQQRPGAAPLDIILAENLRHAAEILRGELAKHNAAGIDLHQAVGLVETSIGKMVPLMRPQDLAIDPLWVFAEPYNTLIVDRRGFRAGAPAVAGLAPKDNMPAYVDRKLFLHNLGHAAAAYFGFQRRPDQPLLCEALHDPTVLADTRAAMHEAAQALRLDYPDEFTAAALAEHSADLLHRFRNRALGDTVYRVGRDLYRKLSREDRLIGALRLCHRRNVPCPTIARALLAACRFHAADEAGRPFAADARFHQQEMTQGLPHVLRQVCGLNPADPVDAAVIRTVLAASAG